MRRLERQRRLLAEAAKEVRLTLKRDVPQAKPSAIRKAADALVRQALSEMKH